MTGLGAIVNISECVRVATALQGQTYNPRLPEFVPRSKGHVSD